MVFNIQGEYSRFKNNIQYSRRIGLVNIQDAYSIFMKNIMSSQYSRRILNIQEEYSRIEKNIQYSRRISKIQIRGISRVITIRAKYVTSIRFGSARLI